MKLKKYRFGTGLSAAVFYIQLYGFTFLSTDKLEGIIAVYA